MTVTPGPGPSPRDRAELDRLLATLETMLDRTPGTLDELFEAERHLDVLQEELACFFDVYGTPCEDLSDAHARAAALIEALYTSLRQAELSGPLRREMLERMRALAPAGAALDERVVVAAVLAEPFFSELDVPVLLAQHLLFGDPQGAAVLAVPAWLTTLLDPLVLSVEVVAAAGDICDADLHAAYILWDPYEQGGEFRGFGQAVTAARRL